MWLANLAMIETLALEKPTLALLAGPSFGDASVSQCFILEFVASLMFIFIIHAAAADSN